eukprot:2669779-Alexandrium_andersonii.AAC.1
MGQVVVKSLCAACCAARARTAAAAVASTAPTPPAMTQGKSRGWRTGPARRRCRGLIEPKRRRASRAEQVLRVRGRACDGRGGGQDLGAGTRRGGLGSKHRRVR